MLEIRTLLIVLLWAVTSTTLAFAGARTERELRSLPDDLHPNSLIFVCGDERFGLAFLDHAVRELAPESAIVIGSPEPTDRPFDANYSVVFIGGPDGENNCDWLHPELQEKLDALRAPFPPIPGLSQEEYCRTGFSVENGRQRIVAGITDQLGIDCAEKVLYSLFLDLPAIPIDEILRGSSMYRATYD